MKVLRALQDLSVDLRALTKEEKIAISGYIRAYKPRAGKKDVPKKGASRAVSTRDL